jgi:hypothetical protein
MLRASSTGRNRRSHKWFRVFNEVSVLLFIGRRGAGGRQAVLMRHTPQHRAAAGPAAAWAGCWCCMPACIRSRVGAGRRGMPMSWPVAALPWPTLQPDSTTGPTCLGLPAAGRLVYAGRRAQRLTHPGGAAGGGPAADAAVRFGGGGTTVPARARPVAERPGAQRLGRRGARSSPRRPSRLAWVDRWQALRESWFARNSALALAAAGAVAGGACCFLHPVPMGLGQVGEVLRDALAGLEGRRALGAGRGRPVAGSTGWPRSRR